MSSNDSRMSSVWCRIVHWYWCENADLAVLYMEICRHAAVNNRRQQPRRLRSGAGGETGERHDTASSVGRGGAAAPESGRGDAPLFTGGSASSWPRTRCRSSTRCCARIWSTGVPVTEAAAAHGYSRAAFYLVAAAFEQAGMTGLLDERRGRRGPVKLTRRSWSSSAPRAGRAPSSPSRSPTGSGCGCTGAPWNGPAGGERPVVLAAGRGGAGRLRDAAHARAVSTVRLPRRAGRGPVRPPRPGRTDRVAGRRAGLRRRTARRARPPWTPHDDPRLEALAAGFALLLDLAADRDCPPMQSLQGLR